jgi:hypothetical protein
MVGWHQDRSNVGFMDKVFWKQEIEFGCNLIIIEFFKTQNCIKTP